MELGLERQSITPLGDVGYNDRHSLRNRARAQSVVRNCTPGERALDIGCNAGYFSRALLSSGLANAIDAIEFDPSIVPDDLKADDRFSLHSGDAVGFEFRRQYHLTVYGAVHHHLFATHGYERAMRFWLDVVRHTESLIFIESGQLAEGSRWYWQRALRCYYSSDEDYFADLIFAIGPRLKNVRLIDSFWIHGVRRWLLLIELWPPGATVVPKRAGPEVQIEQEWRRTVGSRKQELVDSHDGDRAVHKGVAFRAGRIEDGRRVFCKKYVAHFKADYEFNIGSQIDDPRFIRAIGISDVDGLIFPFVDLPTLASVRPDAVNDAEALCRAIEDLFNFAERKRVVIDFAGRRELRLTDLIDLHASNIFCDVRGPSLVVFDFEMHSLANWSRNRMHLAKMLLRWGGRDYRTIKIFAGCLFSYAWGLVTIARRPPDQRVMERTVSAPWWAYARLREYFDQCVMAVLPRYRQ